MTKLKSNSLLVTLNLIFTLVTYRSVFQGRLLGEPFDARLMIVLHEHWWNWFNGSTTFRNTNFFYPFDTAFGFSEIFFAQGIIYSLFRMLTIDALSAWMITNILFLVIGNLGWYFLGQKYISSTALKIIFSMTMISSISFVAYFNFYQNILGYVFLSWFSLLIIKIKETKIDKVRYLYQNLFIFLFLIYIMSCWYAAFFLGSILLIWYVSARINDFIQCGTFRLKNNFYFYLPYLLVFAPINFGLLWLFYFTQVSALSQVNRLNLDIASNSSTLVDLLNSGSPYENLRAFNILPFINDFFLKTPTTDLNIGVGPLLVILTFSLGIYYVIKFGFKKEYLWIASSLILYLVFVRLTTNLSLFSFISDFIPVLNAIRFPGRFVVILGFLFIFIVFVILDRIRLNYENFFTKIVTLVIGILLLMDQQRSPYHGWEKSKFISAELVAFERQIKKECDYFYFDYPGGGWWYEQIEAMALSMRTGVPTVNGYSGGFPIDYPVEVFNSTSEPKEIFNWIEQIDKTKRGCYLTGKSDLLKLDQDFENLQLMGFDESAKSGERVYTATSPNPYIYFTSKKKKSYRVSFNFNSSNCNSNQILRIVNESDNELLMELEVFASESIFFDIDMSQSYVKRIVLITNANSCSDNANSLDTYFSVSDLNFR